MDTTKVKERPWQGTTLGVLYIIGLIILGLMITALIVAIAGGGAMLSQMMQQSSEIASFPIETFLGTMGTLLLIPIIGIFILIIFMTIGIFKGQNWAVIVAIIFTVLGLLSCFTNNIHYFSLALNAFILYLEIMCVKHPFYTHK